MNINQIIEGALSDVTENIWPLFCPEARAPDEYIVYNPELEEAGYFADDADQEWTDHMQIHLFTKKNFIKKKKEIKEQLKSVGFLVTGIETLYEKDTKYYHLIFLCSIDEEAE